MKLRIKGNSIRIRLSVPEVNSLSAGTALKESTVFPNTKLVYAVQAAESKYLSASFENNTITLSVPRSLLSGWASNNVVGFEETMRLENGESLKLLIEKDFKCLDVTEEDQSQFFENPAKSC
jgi:hypothetical protein